MLKRYAAFEGVIPDVEQVGFQQAVRHQLMPAVRNMPGVLEVAVSFCHSRDYGAPNIIMFLVTNYADEQAIEVALTSPQRQRAQEITDQIFSNYSNYRIHHYLTNTYSS